MEARGEPVSRCARGHMRTYFKNLSIQRKLWKHPSLEGLVQPSEKFRQAIERIRESEVDTDDADIARISLLLRAAVGRMKNLTAREVSLTSFQLRDTVLEQLDENDALRAENNALKKEHEELQVDYNMVREERDESQNENSHLGAENASLRARLVELQAASRGGSVTPTPESTSPTADSFHTAPSSPQLGPGPQQPPSTLTRVPTEIIPPVTPPRATISRSPSGLPTPPTTDARRPLGPRPSRSGSRESFSSRRSESFRENTPGAASVRGATPGSPSRRPQRRSRPLRQLSIQNLDQAPSGSDLPRAPPRGEGEVGALFDDLDRDAQRRCDEHRAHIKRVKEQVEQKARAERDDHEQRVLALTNARRMKEEELAKVREQLETLQAQRRTETQEHQALVAQYNDLHTRVGTLTGALNGLAAEATAVVNEHNASNVGAMAGEAV
ncbi:hypothetical protein GSI_13084 [Ganoderma sinense ZZ0214-1]|uniref:Uncharacterized protein n=1 Tax=Ganoderma sinense ZZ0214-1 TaxID=1077348 RepID=A0A2G8RUK6_9APHY|nr:hypothetical protein GSI_13084 [Ganoderma sinense ZZ0214-1]